MAQGFSGLLELKASCIVHKKGDKLVELVSFCVVEFILQNCEIGDFHQFDLAFVLLLPASQNRIEDTFGQIGSEDRTHFESQLRQTFFLDVVGQSSFNCFINDNA